VTDDLVDERLYREKRCYLCLEVVPDNEGERWRVWRNGCRHHLYLHRKCSRRIRAIYRSRARRRLERVLPELRAMRPTEETHNP
jgi:hypothetical protein